MKLTREEEGMLDGKSGAAVQKAMELLVALGDLYDAEGMVDIASSHLIAPELLFRPVGMYVDWVRELAGELLQGAERFRVPTTMDPVYIEPEFGKKIGYPSSLMDQVAKALEQGAAPYRRLGLICNFTCHPYFLHPSRKGQHLGGAESNAVVFSNTVFGAMLNRESAPTALATALTGRTPLFGMHLPQNRCGETLVELKDDLKPADFSYSDYGVLSYYAGQVTGDRIPVFCGLRQEMTLTELMHLCAPLGVSAGLAMAHVVGVTPEAPTPEAAFGGRKPKERIPVGKAEMRQTYQRLSTATDEKVDMVAFGCPHATITEIQEIARLLVGRRVNSKVKLFVSTSEPVRVVARDSGLVEAIESAGGLVVSGMCTGPTFLPGRQAAEIGVKVIATNSAKLAHYVYGPGIWLGSTKKCVDAAI
ncbi:MAG: aconitase X catalytic domain-containing protein, partial [Chloroflexota bacterium]